MSENESRPATSGDREVTVYASVSTMKTDKPRVYGANDPRELQVVVCAGISLFMTIEDWRALNRLVEAHITEHMSEQVLPA